MDWQLIDSGCQPPDLIMKRDQELLSNLTADSQPILHLYEWDGPSLTYGYFTQPLQFLDERMLKKYSINCAKRPTGGGIIFHLTDWAFSLLIPSHHPAFSLNTLDNYAYVNLKIVQVLTSIFGNNLNPKLYFSDQTYTSSCASHFCMAKPTQYDIIINDKKVGGAAQRRTKSGYLHQGSVSLAMPPISLLEEVIKDRSILESMKRNSYCILDENWTDIQLEGLRYELRKSIENVFLIK